MQYEYRDFDSARSGRKRTFSIGLAVTLITVAAVGYFVWINSDRSAENAPRENIETPADEVSSNLPPVSENTPTENAKSDDDVPEVTVAPEVENTVATKEILPVPEDEPSATPEKGKPYVEDLPYEEDQPVRPPDLTGEAKVAFESKLAAAGDDLDKLQALATEVPENSQSYFEVANKIGEINMKRFTGKLPDPKMKLHTVVSGDNLSKIAKSYQVTAESIALANNITNPNLIRIGQKLKIYSGDWSIKIDKSARVLKLYESGRLFKLYEIGVGRAGSTPEGEFTVFIRLKDPSWGAVPGGSPDNELGTRYLGLARNGVGTEYAIHGSRDESSVGRSWSGGCIRMHNPDAEELFAIVEVGTPVLIIK